MKNKRLWKFQWTLETGKRRCSNCHLIKLKSEFFKDRSKQDGIESKCKFCVKSFREKNSHYHFSVYQRGAKRRGYKFSLSFDEFVSFLGLPCSYCHIKLDRVRLDRVNNSQGYILKNVIPCCRPCNIEKGSLAVESILRMAFTINKHLSL